MSVKERDHSRPHSNKPVRVTSLKVPQYCEILMQLPVSPLEVLDQLARFRSWLVAVMLGQVT